MRTSLIILLGLAAAAVGGFVAWLFAGAMAAAAVAVLALALAIWASGLQPGWNRRATLGALLALLLGAIGLTIWQVSTLVRALGDRTGPVASADPVHLESASSKLDNAGEAAGFRLELEEGELTALVQDSLSAADTPIGAVVFDVDPTDEVVHFTADFRSGDLTLAGAVDVAVEAGGLDLALRDLDIGAMTVPGALSGAIEDIVSRVADFEGALAESGSTVQSVDYTGNSLILTGTSRSGQVLTSDQLLAALGDQAASSAGAVDPPPERLGPGRVNGAEAEGSSYVVALGDSLAANVGVDEPRDGYVSRFHAAVERRDDTAYGLRNFGVPGETSGSLLNGGQLDEAIGFMTTNDVAYVTIDIGANDLLGHMGSPDCGDDLTSADCQSRIEDALAIYEPTLGEVLDEIATAAPGAAVVFLQTYNPFSLGMASFVELEITSDAIVSRLNEIAAEAATVRGILVADGFTPMQGTTAATTHMTDSPPDIHPRAIGFDVLAYALVEALER